MKPTNVYMIETPEGFSSGGQRIWVDDMGKVWTHLRDVKLHLSMFKGDQTYARERAEAQLVYQESHIIEYELVEVNRTPVEL